MPIIAHAATDDTPQFDSIIELGIDDDAYGDPAGWPEWTDEWRWVPTEPDPDDVHENLKRYGYHPAPEPAPYEPSEANWQDYLDWSARLEAMEPGYPAE
jgi:hypothetical protein